MLSHSYFLRHAKLFRLLVDVFFGLITVYKHTICTLNFLTANLIDTFVVT